jgi:tape measure domain-containing protein
MLNVGSLRLDLSVTLSKFHRALDDAVGRISKLGEEMERSFGPKPRKEIDKTEERFQRFTWAVRGYVKDTSKVITGILISQSFYNLLNTVESAVYSLGRFNAEMQEAAVSFELLLGSRREAEGFLYALEDFTAKTPLVYEQTQRLATQLMALGFNAKAVIPIMQAVIDAATVRGAGPDVVEGIANALGQILTKGKVEWEEMMQLAERGIPAFQILREELGLTAKQMENLGKQGIPAETAIRALLIGIEKRFGGAAERINRTTRGLISNIHDNLMFLGNTVFTPVFESIRVKLEQLADRLQYLRKITRERGLGALLQELFPPQLQGTIKSILIALKSLADGFVALRDAVMPIASAVGEIVLRTLGIVLPIISALVRTLAELAKWLTSNVPLVRHLAGTIATLIITGTVLSLLQRLALAIKALAIAGPVARLIVMLKNAILALHAAMVRNPIIGVITLLSAALIGLALSSKTASAWLDRIMRQMGKLLGYDMGSMLQPEDPSAINKWWSEYNKSFKEFISSGQSLGTAKDAIDDVGDSTKKAGGKAKKAGGEFKKFLAAFDEVYEVPEQVKDMSAGGLGDLGGLLPGIPNIPDVPALPEIGAPSIDEGKLKEGVGWLDRLKEKLEELGKSLKDKGPLIIPPPQFLPPLPSVVEDLAAFLAKLAVLYALATAGVREWVRRFNESLDRLGQPLRDALERMRRAWEGFESDVRQRVRGVVDAFQALPAKVWQVWEDVRTAVQEKVQGVVDVIKQLPARVGESFDAFKQRAAEGLSAVTSFFEEHKGLIIGILGAIVFAVAAWVASISATVAAGAATFILVVTTMFTNAKKAAAATLDQTRQEVQTKWDQIKQAIEMKLNAIWTSITTRWDAIKTSITTKLVAIWTSVSTWWNNIKTTIDTILTNIWTSVSTWWDTIKTTIETALTDIWTSVFTWWDAIKTTIETLMQEISNSVTTVWTTIQTTISGIVQGIYTSVTGKFQELKNTVLSIWESLKSATQSVWNEIKDTIKRTINHIIEAINKFIRKFNRIQIRVPEFHIPFVGTFGGFTVDLPDIPELPLLDTGGIVTRDTIVRLAGNNRPEAVIPLQGEAARPFAEMIADAIAAVMPEGIASPMPPLYVGTLIADERGLKELARKLEIINLRESQRRGGRIR